LGKAVIVYKLKMENEVSEKEELQLMDEVLKDPSSKGVEIKKDQWKKCNEGLKNYRTKYREMKDQMKEEEKRMKAQIRMEYNRKIKEDMKQKKELKPPTSEITPTVEMDTPLSALKEEPPKTEIPFPVKVEDFSHMPTPPITPSSLPNVVDSIGENIIPNTPMKRPLTEEEYFELLDKYENHKKKRKPVVPPPSEENSEEELSVKPPPVQKSVSFQRAPATPSIPKTSFFFLRK
jgi:hypothetical protein